MDVFIKLSLLSLFYGISRVRLKTLSMKDGATAITRRDIQKVSWMNVITNTPAYSGTNRDNECYFFFSAVNFIIFYLFPIFFMLLFIGLDTC